MEEISEIIFNILNVASITSEASGGVFALMADSEDRNFVCYDLAYSDSTSKSGRKTLFVNINVVADSYQGALRIFDAVSPVLLANKIYIEDFKSEYISQNKEAMISAQFRYNKTIINL